MDIHQLRTLVCVAEVGSLSRAADRLCTAQPALSRHVRMLEEELGTRLFDRHGRGMILTEQGNVVLERALRILQEFDDIKSNVAEGNGALGGHISIGMPPTVTEMLAVPLINAIREQHPNVTCRIVSAYSLYLFDWVHRGEVDVAILYDPQSIRSLRSEFLLEEDLYVVAPPGAGLALDTPISFRALHGKPMLLPSAGHSLRQIIELAAEESRTRMDVKVEVDSYSALRQFLLGGQGWTILPMAAVQADLAAERLCAAPLSDPATSRHLELSVPADRPTSRLASFVMEMIITTATGLVNEGTWPARMLTR